MTIERSRTWIIGATSGVGRATATRLAGSRRELIVSGRRARELEQVAGEVTGRGGQVAAAPVDVSDRADLARAVASFPGGVDQVDELVFCAGRNVRNRQWAVLTDEEFAGVIETNLIAVAEVIRAVLPGMLARGTGRIVVISSWAGWTFGRGAGVAYSASKTALLSLTESLNDQHGPDGISAGVICPGDIDTPLIDNRPVVPDAQARARMLTADDVARTVEFVLDMPRHLSINELVISPTHSHSYGR